ncbi:hypothetical protein BCR34DRAFT_606683 [Clohesyomyces aquaticus]|uniref:Uncharacterized protein n=1 Tax=Clohesyomyces aquaticus TaxID=1231657 RepID=A0A1Y1YMG5_9PLEO|nr:hypothetical protein BCR34DRAFT_606683 [Clohesyomyces aquaticus]
MKCFVVVPCRVGSMLLHCRRNTSLKSLRKLGTRRCWRNSRRANAYSKKPSENVKPLQKQSSFSSRAWTPDVADILEKLEKQNKIVEKPADELQKIAQLLRDLRDAKVKSNRAKEVTKEILNLLKTMGWSGLEDRKNIGGHLSLGKK